MERRSIQRKKIGTAFIFLITVFWFQACTVPHVEVAAGNQQFHKGEFQKAIVAYSKVLENEMSKGYREWIFYNLGNVFFALGEYESAGLEWRKSGEIEAERLEFNLLFNRGVLQYRLGEYAEAYTFFKRALEIEPQSTAAKINLEYVLKKLEADHTGEDGAEATSSKDGGNGAETDKQSVDRILEYVRRQETGLRRSADQQKSESKVNDW
jgi:tetratricopeptide (TPR) repeat protein